MSTEPTPQIHENLMELLQKLKSAGSIANVVARTIKNTLSATETTLLCFYQLDMNDNTGSTTGEAPTMSSCEVFLITTGRFISLGFFPTYHRTNVQDVYKVSAFELENRFSTGYETEGDATSAEERGYNPIELRLKVQFADRFDKHRTEWLQDTSRPEDIKSLYKQTQTLAKITGIPLAEVKLEQP